MQERVDIAYFRRRRDCLFAAAFVVIALTVSTATFPSYFSEEETAHARAGASVDATLYATHIARALNIRVRYEGEQEFYPGP